MGEEGGRRGGGRRGRGGGGKGKVRGDICGYDRRNDREYCTHKKERRDVEHSKGHHMRVR